MAMGNMGVGVFVGRKVRKLWIQAVFRSLGTSIAYHGRQRVAAVQQLELRLKVDVGEVHIFPRVPRHAGCSQPNRCKVRLW